MYTYNKSFKKIGRSRNLPSGFPNLPIGMVLINLVLTLSGIAAVIGVTIIPGNTELNLIPLFASSNDAVLVNRSTPALLAA